MRVLAVGGGGLRDYHYEWAQGTGAGSGYVTNFTSKFPCESFEVSLRVGGPGEASTIKASLASTIAIALGPGR